MRAPGMPRAAARTIVHELLLGEPMARFGSTGRSSGSFMVTKTIPVLTSPPPKPPTQPP